MKNTKLILFILILALGVTFEAFKNVNFDEPKNSAKSLTGNELKDFDLKPFNSNQLKKHSKTKPKKSRFVINKQNLAKVKMSDINFKKTHDFNETKKGIPPKKKSRNKKVKKKDKKKLIAGKKEEDIKYDNADKPETKNNEANVVNNDGLGNGGFAPFGGSNPQNGNNKLKTFEEWIAILLVRPSYKKTTQFTDDYRSNLVTNSIFYQVLDAMLEDNSDEVNGFGIIAAGSFPSIDSFEVLSDSIELDSINSKNKSLARDKLQIYTDLQYLNTLRSVLVTSESFFAQTLATNLVIDSANKNLGKENNATTTNLTPLGRDSRIDDIESLATLPIIKRYQELSEILSDLLTSENFSNGFTQAANTAISVINNLTII